MSATQRAGKDVLTQEEIDALLAGVDDGAVEPGKEDAEGISLYDFSNQERTVHGRLPTLEIISERFSRLLRNSLPSSLKFPIEVGPGGSEVVKYSEYIGSLYVPTSIKLLRIQPFAGTCLLTIEAKLIRRIVDLFFGGDGAAGSFEGKEFSLTEQRVINRITDLAISEFLLAWQDILPVSIDVINDESNPNLVNILNPSDALMVCSFRLELEDGGGELQIAFPYASLEPFKSVLDTTAQTETEDIDSAWRIALEHALLNAEVPLSCVIGEAQLKLRQLMRMQPGDVLDIDMQEVHQVSIANKPAFNASLGDSRGKFALEFATFDNR